MTYQERLFRQRIGYGCEPVSATAGTAAATTTATSTATAYMVASLAIAAASAAASIQAQQQQASAQAQQQQSMAKAQNETAAVQMSQLRTQEAQQREAAARENEKARLASQKAKASSTVAAGEAGVSGASVNALLGEHAMQLGQFKEATNRQSQLNSQGINDQISAVRENTRFGNLQINAPIARPNVAAEFTRLGASALGSYRAYKQGGKT